MYLNRERLQMLADSALHIPLISGLDRLDRSLVQRTAAGAGPGHRIHCYKEGRMPA